ncbi:hypothetical protein MCRH_1935 [Moraxella catarrhalis RH4]|nr:hypothetical protein EJK50_2009 [Moraxella catarrhalis]EKF82936.1 hypothetical protein MCRH_1935 [Moraxella catarrhalis RH4]
MSSEMDFSYIFNQKVHEPSKKFTLILSHGIKIDIKNLPKY